MKKRERTHELAVTIDDQTYNLLLAVAEEDFNSVEYELRIAIRKGLEQLAGVAIAEED